MQIRGSELLTGVFGYWPSFHDAEVTRLTLETTLPYGGGPNLFVDLHTFEMTDDIGPDGSYVLRNHILVSFRFEGIDQLRLNDFNNQNALWDLSIVDIRDRQLELLKYEVHFNGTFGVDAEFLCRDVSVEGVRPWGSETDHA